MKYDKSRDDIWFAYPWKKNIHGWEPVGVDYWLANYDKDPIKTREVVGRMARRFHMTPAEIKEDEQIEAELAPFTAALEDNGT
jgi:hypothetical protein